MKLTKEQRALIDAMPLGKRMTASEVSRMAGPAADVRAISTLLARMTAAGVVARAGSIRAAAAYIKLREVDGQAGKMALRKVQIGQAPISTAGDPMPAYITMREDLPPLSVEIDT